MKYRCILICLFIGFFLVGCESYRDINKTQFATATIIDVNEEGKVIVYMECFMAYYSQLMPGEKGLRSILKGEGDTISEAIQEIDKTSRHSINAVYSKNIIYTEKAAKKGLGSYLDYPVRDQEIVLRSYIMLLKGDPIKFLESNLSQGDYKGLYLEDLLQSDNIKNTIHPYHMADYVNQVSGISKTTVVGILELQEDETDPFIGIKEAGVIKDNKMVDTLSENEFKTYCLLERKAKSIIISVPSPENDKEKIALFISGNKTKKSLSYSGDSGSVVTYKETINLTVNLEETSGQLDLTDKEIRNEIASELEDKIRSEGIALFEKFQRKDIDILKVSERFYNIYPKEKGLDVLGSTKFELEVHVDIKGSSNTQNYHLE